MTVCSVKHFSWNKSIRVAVPPLTKYAAVDGWYRIFHRSLPVPTYPFNFFINFFNTCEIRNHYHIACAWFKSHIIKIYSVTPLHRVRTNNQDMQRHITWKMNGQGSRSFAKLPRTHNLVSLLIIAAK